MAVAATEAATRDLFIVFSSFDRRASNNLIFCFNSSSFIFKETIFSDLIYLFKKKQMQPFHIFIIGVLIGIALCYGSQMALGCSNNESVEEPAKEQENAHVSPFVSITPIDPDYIDQLIAEANKTSDSVNGSEHGSVLESVNGSEHSASTGLLELFHAEDRRPPLSQCEYIFKRKGGRCEKMTRDTFCSSHKKYNHGE